MANTHRELRKQMLTKISTGLKAETEGLIIAAQDKRLATSSYLLELLKTALIQCSRYAIDTRKRYTILCLAALNLQKLGIFKDTTRQRHIHIRRHVSIATSRYRRSYYLSGTSSMNMNQQRSLKVTNLQYFGICKYTQIEK